MEHSDNQISTCDTNCERYCSHHTIGAHCRTEDDIQIRPKSHQNAPERSHTTPSITTKAPNERTPKIRALRPLGTLSGPRNGAHGCSREHASERHRVATASGAVAAETSAMTPAIPAVAAVTMSGHHLRIGSANTSQHVCERRWLHEPGCARVGGRGWAHLGARRRSRRSGRPSEPTGQGRAHPRDGQRRAPPSERPLETAA